MSENKEILANTSFLIKDIEDYVGGVVDRSSVWELRKRNRKRNRKGVKWILSSTKHKVFVDQPRQFQKKEERKEGLITDDAIEQLLKGFDPSQNIKKTRSGKKRLESDHLKSAEELKTKGKFDDECDKSALNKTSGTCGLDVSNERVRMSVKCDHCDEIFDRKHHMIRHVINFHDKVIDVPCQLCDYKTHSTFNLRVHMHQTHKGQQGPYNGKTQKQACLFCLQTTNIDLTNKVAEITDLRKKLGKKNNEIRISEETISKLKQEKLKLVSAQALEIESYQTENNILKNDNHNLLEENVKLSELKVENEILAATLLQMKSQEDQKNVVIPTADNSFFLRRRVF